jgi:hypothetical protein
MPQVQAVSHRFLTEEAPFCAQVSPREVYGRLGGTGSGFSSSPSILRCQYHPVAAPGSFVCHLGDGRGAQDIVSPIAAVTRARSVTAEVTQNLTPSSEK